MKLFILFALVAAAVADPVPRFDLLRPTGRIIGGFDTTIEQAPHQASVQAFGIHVCGGVIVHASWILTAGSCFIFPSGWYTIRTGTSFVSSGGVVSPIALIITHPDYITNTLGVARNDIGIVRLSTPLTLGTTQSPISMFAPGQEAAVGALATITGWGTVAEGGHSPSVLQAVSVPIVSKADCNTAYSAWGGIADGQICAGLAEGGQNSCDSDTGSPVTINGALAGIVSWAHGCGRAGFPGVYTEISAYRLWIMANTGI